MSTLLNLMGVIALIGMCLALWRPERFYPFKEPTWIKAVGLYFFIAVALFILASSLTPGDNADLLASDIEEKARPTASGPLTWREINRESMPMPANGRDRLLVTIVPLEDQARAGQRELLATAASVAVKFQKESGTPVVVVNMVAQETEKVLAAPLLAHVVYIPDGKGYDGAAAGTEQWESRSAAQRGFTASELEYLKIRAELFPAFQGPTGIREKDLDAAVSGRMGIAAGTLRPLDNKAEAVRQ